MGRLGLIALILTCTGLTAGLIAWPELTDLRRSHPWWMQHAEADHGMLAEATVSVSAAEAMVLPQRPDRAVVYLRLGLQGGAAAMQGWLSCDVALTDAQGRRWLPLTNRLGLGIIQLLGGEGAAGRGCPQALLQPATNAPALSDQAFLVPVGAVEGLRVEISGRGTLPNALSLPVRPRLRLQLD